MTVTDDTTTEDAQAPAEDAPTEPEGDEAGAEALGDAGKQALDRMKAQRNAERDKRRELETRLAALESKADGDQPDPEALRAEGRRDALAASNQRILRSEIKAAAAGKLSDPADALQLLDLSRFEVDDDGNVDEDEIAEAIDDLLKKKPYLAAQGGKRFGGNADGGARKESRPTQLTRDDLKRMSPAEIEDARVAGRLNDLLNGS